MKLKMDRYKIRKELGDGTCGSVYEAINMETYEIVAVKKMKRKFYSWEECTNLREVKSLRKLSHPNIIQLKEIVRENNELFFIFEYMEHNLYQIMRDRKISSRPFSEEEIRLLMYQMLQGISHMHGNGYFHRDLKPENLLVTDDIIKIADFGLAREVSSAPPFTDYVSTRWYRAPEVLLQSLLYTPAIDMWAVGAILAELFTSLPIFPGKCELDQLDKICSVLGAPDWNAFPEARKFSELVRISYSQTTPVNLSHVIPNASLEAIDLIKQLCSWDPLRRPTADQCLRHSFFHAGMRIPRSLGDLPFQKLNDMGAPPDLELSLWNFGNKADDSFLGLTLAINPSVPNLDTVHKSQNSGKDALFSSGFEDNLQQSAFWPLLPPNHHGISAPMDPSLSLSFSSIPQSTTGIPQSAGFSVGATTQPYCSFLTMASPYQQGHCL